MILLKILGTVANLKERLESLEGMHESIRELVDVLVTLSATERTQPKEEQNAEPPVKKYNPEMDLKKWNASVPRYGDSSESSRWRESD